MACRSPVPIDELAAYWLGELPAAEGDKVEEHFFACAHCAGRLEWLAALSDGVRASVRAGAFGMVVTAPFVEALKQAGFRLREYRTEPGGRRNCTMAADDDAVVSRLQAPLAGVQRLDLVAHVRVGEDAWPEMRLEDVPFDPAGGEVLYILPPRALKAMPAHTARMHLVAVDGKGERRIGEYTFAHTPS